MEFASLIYVIVVNICLQNIFVDSITGTLIPPTSYEDLVGIHTTYYAMGFEHTWYEARDVCQSIGGDLAKLPSEDIIIAMKNNNSAVESFLTNKHYFTSAVRLTEDISVWSSECSEFNLNMTAPSVTSYKDGFTTPVCLSIHGDHFHNEDCNNARQPFLCETKTRTCKMVDTFDTEIIQFNHMDKTECNRLCDADATCWAAITTPTHCIMATVSGYGLADFSMSTKQCTNSFAVQYHESNINLVYPTVSNVEQSAAPPNCTPSVRTTPPIPTTTTTTTTQSTTTTPLTTSGTTTPKAISPTPPQIVTSTVTVMSTDIVVSTVIVRSTDVVVSTAIVTSIQYDTAHVTPTQIVVCSTEKVTATTTATATVTAQVCSSSIPSSALTTATLSSVWVLDNEAIDRKNTSNYRRSLTSAMDFRATSSLIGGFGVTLIIIPLVAFILSDIRAIVRHWRRHESIYNISKNDSKPEI